MMNKQLIIDKIKELARQLDDKYQYSDDHKYWKRQNRLHQQVRFLEEKLAGIDGFPTNPLQEVNNEKN